MPPQVSVEISKRRPGRDLATLLAFRLAELGIDAGSLALSTMAE
jgi:hypothetical protein